MPPGEPESNYRMAAETMFAQVPVPPENVHRIRAEDASAESAARAYERDLEEHFRLAPGQFPRFDLVLLGLGTDGHTASLFPGTKVLSETRRRAVSNWIGKLDTERITLTAPTFNAAAEIVFLVSGEDKAAPLKSVLEGPYEPTQLPAQLIRPAAGRTLWLADRARREEAAAAGRRRAMSRGLVLLFDVDNTLLDNDRVTADLREYLEKEVGAERAEHYWRLFEQLRSELGYADYLGALQRYRIEYPRDPHLLTVSRFLINYPFANRLYPESLDVLDRARQWGATVILTDGDVVFQPRKIERSGLFEAVGGNVLIYVHKERELDDVAARYPAAALRARGRQAADPRRGQAGLGTARDDRVSSPGSLRARRGGARPISAAGRHDRAHRKFPVPRRALPAEGGLARRHPDLRNPAVDSPRVKETSGCLSVDSR